MVEFCICGLIISRNENVSTSGHGRDRARGIWGFIRCRHNSSNGAAFKSPSHFQFFHFFVKLCQRHLFDLHGFTSKDFGFLINFSQYSRPSRRIPLGATTIGTLNFRPASFICSNRWAVSGSFTTMMSPSFNLSRRINFFTVSPRKLPRVCHEERN